MSELLLPQCSTISSGWLYPTAAWFCFSCFMSAASLVYTAVEAWKKHIAIEEAHEDSDDNESSFYSDDDGSDLSSMYETMPEEYRPAQVQRPGSRLTSIARSLDQINEDEESEEEKDIVEAVNEENEDSDSESDFTVVNIPSGFKNHRSSLTRKDDILRVESLNSNDTSSIDSKSVASSRSDSRSAPGLVPGFKSQEIISRSAPQTPRLSLKVPEQTGSSLKRSESQNRADFLLKMMAKGGDVNSFKSTTTNVIEKRSPTGRKISVDIRQRAKDTKNTF